MPSSKPILSNVGLAVTAATFTNQEVQITGGDITSTSTTFVDATGLTFTVARTVTGGIFFASTGLTINNTAQPIIIRWVNGATNKTAVITPNNAVSGMVVSVPLSGALTSQVIKIQWRMFGASTGTIYGGTSTDQTSLIQLVEIG